MDLYRFETPFGPMALGAEDEALVRLYLPNSPTPRLLSRATPLLAEGARQVQDYLAGKRRSFDLPIRLEGTPFQSKVWSALADIPFGQTRSYGQLAWTIGSPRAARAVGMACRQDPLPLLIPCHRVTAADGSPGGYAGGVPLKKALLELERRQ